MKTRLRAIAPRSAFKKNRLSLIVCVLILVPVYLNLSSQTKPHTSVDRSSFAGTWKGLCDDGKTFILLTLNPTSNQIDGTISLGNVKFASSTVSTNNNSCTVADAPDPAHAFPIKNAALDGNKLSFEYSHGQQIELDLTPEGTAKLRFPGTPYEESSFVISKSN